MKIWHHSMTDLSKLVRYRANICSHAKAVLDEDVELVTHGAPPGAYSTVAPVEALRYPYTEFLCERFVCEAAMAAEKNGYDVLTIGCYLDTGLQKARSLVDIPVLAVTEASMLVSCTLGKKFGIVTITPSMREHLMDSAVCYGLENRAAAILSIEPPVHEYMMEGDEESGTIVEQRFLLSCDKALEAGADVVIPGEGVLNEFLLARGVTSYKGVPILDGNAVLWQFAVMQAKLREKSGVGVGRRMAYKKPPSDLLDTLQTVHSCYNLEESDFS